MQADFKAKEDAESASKIDPKHALITLAAGLTVRYYLMDIIKVMVILAILLGDASFVVALFTRQAHVSFVVAPFTKQAHASFVVALFTRQAHVSFACVPTAAQADVL